LLNDSKIFLISDASSGSSSSRYNLGKEDKLTVIEGQFNAMQSQMRALITALGNMDGQNKIEFAKQLYNSGVYETE
jgi:hypothetical protein